MCYVSRCLKDYGYYIICTVFLTEELKCCICKPYDWQHCAIGNMERVSGQPVRSNTECSVSLEKRWLSRVLICSYTFSISHHFTILLYILHFFCWKPDFSANKCQRKRVAKCLKLSEKIAGVCWVPGWIGGLFWGLAVFWIEASLFERIWAIICVCFIIE